MAAVVATAVVVSTAATSGAAVGEQVDKTAVVRLGVPVEVQGGVYFDPAGPRASSTNSSARQYLDLIYDTMIHNTADGKGAPGLATKWTTPDSNTVELTLRKGVKFSDGTPLTAAAVKAAWDRTLAAGRTNLTPNVKAISSIEAVDDTTVRLHLNQPVAQPLIDEDLRSAAIFGVPSPAAIAAGTADTKPVGAGPYGLESYTTGDIKLSKNKAFYDPKAQKAGGFEFIDANFGAPQVSALQAGTVDMIWQPPPDSLETLKSQGFVIFSSPGQAMFVVNLCTSEGPFASKEARQALQYAFDRDAIAQGALSGTGMPLTTLLTPQSPNYNKKFAKTYKYDPKKAKAMLKAAGVTPGTKVTAMAPSTAPYPAIAEVVQSQLKDVGIDAQFTLPTEIGSALLGQSPELSVTVQQPSLFPLALGGQRSALNVCSYKNDQLVTALNTARDAATAPADKQAAWDTVQKIVQDDSSLIPLTTQGVVAVYDKKVKGLEVVNSPWGPQLDTVYIAKQK